MWSIKSKISFVILIELTICILINGDNQSKVTSTTVTQSSNNQMNNQLNNEVNNRFNNNQGALLNAYSKNDLYPQTFIQPDQIYSSQPNLHSQQQVSDLNLPSSDVTYNEPNDEEKLKSKIDLIKKEKYQKNVQLKDQQLNMYKRPSQFSNLIKNQQLIDKQKVGHSLISGRLTTDQLNKLTSSNNDDQVSNDQIKIEASNNESTGDEKYGLDQFAQSLNYLIKFINRQGEIKSINGTDHTINKNNILLKHARNLDRDNCLLRLICEISSNEEDASDNQLVKEIRIVFGNKHKAPTYPTKKDASFPFFYAGHVGAISGRAERCLEVFPVCSVKSDQLLQIVSNSNKYSKNQAKLNRKADKIMESSKLEKELYPTSESRSFSEKMRNKMKKLHKQYIKKMN